MRFLVRLGLSFVLGLSLFAACSGDGDDGGGGSGANGNGGGGAGGSGGSGAAGGNASGGGGSGTGGGGQVYQPAPGTTWQWQLSGLPIDTSFDVAVYDVDLFETTDAELQALHGDGRKVICYFSAGSWESFRPDAASFPDSVKGDPLDPPFQDELWLDIRAPEVREIMKTRLDLAAQRGCDGVEPDNVDGYSNSNGLGLTAADQIDFNRFIAAEAHARGLSVGLKNDLDQLADLVDDFDWALNEECFTYDECSLYSDTFIAANKAVFHAEYVDAGQLDAVCAVTKPLGLSTLLKNIDLDAWQLPCP
ncbi:MAG: endo alpha-1,4 polygalactosaminidase [Polyangiaceae bacterium]|nr:endo alpha-1,4 polygalactosaminidase [Polyangiaceae bacterium]